MTLTEEAAAFGRGETTIQEFWGAFQVHLDELCADGPLDGDWLEVFQELEKWEVATATERDVAVERARTVARRLAERA